MKIAPRFLKQRDFISTHRNTERGSFVDIRLCANQFGFAAVQLQKDVITRNTIHMMHVYPTGAEAAAQGLSS